MHADTLPDLPSPEVLRRVGPFAADGHPFVVESSDEALLATVADRLCDLSVAAPTGGGGTIGGEVTVFTVERNGPSWLSHPWALWRDGEPCETTVTSEYLLPYVIWEVTRLALERAVAPVVPVHAAAVARDGRALVLCGPSNSGKSTLSAWLTHRGWAFLTDEVALLDLTDPSDVQVRPFPRPIGVRRGGPLDEVVEAGNRAEPETDAHPEILVPASTLGPLATTTPLAGIVCPRHVPGSGGALTPLSPAEALTAMAEQLPSLARDGAAVFHALADVVARLPAYALTVDDLDRAEHTLAGLVESIGRNRAPA